MTQTPEYADDSRRYRLDSRLATGGMGEVWRATDTVLDRRVAVKLLKHEYADDASFRVRFESEAQHAASLHHPNIASVYDVGESASPDGSGLPRPFLVMELVDGQPLSALLRPGEPMDPVAARELLAQAADGLGAAHAAGIVHRDVKPANLLVTPTRQVKITDFGIARAAAGVGLTGTGEVLGTPQYLSPEQARGETTTAASDVYALGVVAFECLAGRRPFQGETPVTTALAHIREPVPDLPPSVPADLAAVVRRALAKDPAERYADGAAFAAALRNPAAAYLEATQVTQVVAPPPPVAPTSATGVGPIEPIYDYDDEPESRAWLWAVLGVVAVVLAVVVAVWLVNRGDADDQPDDTATNTPPVSSSPPTTPSEPASSATEDTTIRLDEADYVDRPLADVERELGELGLRVAKERLDNPGDQIEGDVESVNPTGALQPGDTVTVSFWGPLPPPETPTETPTETPSETPAETPSEAASATPTDVPSPTSS